MAGPASVIQGLVLDHRHLQHPILDPLVDHEGVVKTLRGHLEGNIGEALVGKTHLGLFRLGVHQQQGDIALGDIDGIADILTPAQPELFDVHPPLALHHHAAMGGGKTPSQLLGRRQVRQPVGGGSLEIIYKQNP